jgi:hypothetical protein
LKNKNKDDDFVGIIIVDPLRPEFMPSPNEFEKVDNEFKPSDLDEIAGD